MLSIVHVLREPGVAGVPGNFAGSVVRQPPCIARVAVPQVGFSVNKEEPAG